MTEQEASQAITEWLKKKHEALERLMNPARAAVNVLKDLNQQSTARELEVILFELDAAEQEIGERIRANPVAFIDAMSRRLR